MLETLVKKRVAQAKNLKQAKSEKIILQKWMLEVHERMKKQPMAVIDMQSVNQIDADQACSHLNILVPQVPLDSAIRAAAIHEVEISQVEQSIMKLGLDQLQSVPTLNQSRRLTIEEIVRS